MTEHILNSALLEHRRLGIYHVGNMMFIGKAKALAYATASKQKIYWNFNDDVFSSIDWKVPINTSLTELYKHRAQQLRDKYDYLSLSFSGGVDSTNILHSFIDNGIFLDEIIMFRPARTASNANNIDKSNKNIHSEIEFAAIPHLKKYLKDSRTLVRIIDLNSATEEFFNNDNLVSEFSLIHQLGVSQLARTAMCITDKLWNNLYDSGKTVGHIHGIEKPIINFYNGVYTFDFKDTNINFESGVFSETYERMSKYQFHEYFYWTPDLPQLVIKQCQVLKNVCENDFIFKLLFTNGNEKYQDELISMIHYIYPPHVNAIRNLFCTVKHSGAALSAGIHQWFYETMDNTVIAQFNEIVGHTRNSIDHNFFRTENSAYINENEHEKLAIEKNAIKIIKSKTYVL